MSFLVPLSHCAHKVTNTGIKEARYFENKSKQICSCTAKFLTYKSTEPPSKQSVAAHSSCDSFIRSKKAELFEKVMKITNRFFNGF